MPLPKINTPTYELVLPSTGKKIKYRPFLVREEKILIMAMESEEMSEITNAIIQILGLLILSICFSTFVQSLLVKPSMLILHVLMTVKLK